MVSSDWLIEDLVRGALEAVISEDIKHNKKEDRYELTEDQNYDDLLKFFEDRRLKNPKNLIVCMDYKNTFGEATNRLYIRERFYIISLDDIIKCNGKD